MDWSLIASVLVNFWWVLFVYVVTVIVTGLFTDSNYDGKKHRVRCFMDRTLEVFGLVWAGLFFVMLTVCMLTGVPFTPSVPGLKKVAIKIEEINQKRSIEAGQAEAYATSNDIVTADGSPGTKNTVWDKKAENDGTKNIVESNKEENNNPKNSKFKNSNNKSMADKIKYAKQNNYTFLYNNKKVNEEDFDYKNSDVVVLNDLKLVIGMLK